MANSFDLESLGGAWRFEDRPAAVSSESGRLDVFLVGFDRQLYHYWQGPGEAFQLESLGGDWPESPVAAVSSQNRLDVFLVGEDRQLYRLYQWRDEASFELQTVGGSWFSANDISVVSWAPDRLDVFLVGDDRQLYHYWGQPTISPLFPHGHFSFELESLGGSWSSTLEVTAVTWGPGRLDVFLVGEDRQLYHYWQNPGEAFHLESLGDAPYGPIHAVTWGAGRLDVFCVRTGGLAGSDLLYHYWQDPGVGFLKESLGDQYSARGAWATAVTWGPRRLDCFLTNNENDESGHLSSPLFHYWEDDSGSFAKESLGGIWPGGHKLSAVSWGPRRLDVFHVGFDRQLYHYWQG